MHINEEEVDRFVPTSLDEPWRFTIPEHHEPIQVSSGDTLSISATYLNPFEVPIKDAAGILGFYFAPTQ